MESTQESAIKVMNQDFVKLDRLYGACTNFNHWKDKLMFFLTALKVAYVLNPDLPEIPPPKDGESDEVKKQREKRQEDEVMCRGHILNTLSDTLYDLFTAVKSPREIWATVEREYASQKQGAYKIEEGARILHKKEFDSDPRANMVHEKKFKNKRKNSENWGLFGGLVWYVGILELGLLGLLFDWDFVYNAAFSSRCLVPPLFFQVLRPSSPLPCFVLDCLPLSHL
ncbi:hypothetical protein DH2020_016547 [Rehmannia glutinosa]|uniref:Uncharacterized protein n=1 Tax=Rehmannia glutinosa TaxID=99300 RepID=A0ABR0WRR5_REHGL